MTSLDPDNLPSKLPDQVSWMTFDYQTKSQPRGFSTMGTGHIGEISDDSELYKKIQGYVRALNSSTSAPATGTEAVKERTWGQGFTGFVKAMCIRVGNAFSDENTRLESIADKLRYSSILSLDVQDLRWFDDRTIAQLGLKYSFELNTPVIQNAVDNAIKGARQDLTKIALSIFKEAVTAAQKAPIKAATTDPVFEKYREAIDQYKVSPLRLQLVDHEKYGFGGPHGSDKKPLTVNVLRPDDVSLSDIREYGRRDPDKDYTKAMAQIFATSTGSKRAQFMNEFKALSIAKKMKLYEQMLDLWGAEGAKGRIKEEDIKPFADVIVDDLRKPDNAIYVVYLADNTPGMRGPFLEVLDKVLRQDPNEQYNHNRIHAFIHAVEQQLSPVIKEGETFGDKYGVYYEQYKGSDLEKRPYGGVPGSDARPQGSIASETDELREYGQKKPNKDYTVAMAQSLLLAPNKKELIKTFKTLPVETQLTLYEQMCEFERARPADKAPFVAALAETLRARGNELYAVYLFDKLISATSERGKERTAYSEILQQIGVSTKEPMQINLDIRL